MLAEPVGKLVVFLRSRPLQGLVQPVLPILVGAVPMEYQRPKTCFRVSRGSGEQLKRQEQHRKQWSMR